jgi:hypothetical protein
MSSSHYSASLHTTPSLSKAELLAFAHAALPGGDEGDDDPSDCPRSLAELDRELIAAYGNEFIRQGETQIDEEDAAIAEGRLPADELSGVTPLPTAIPTPIPAGGRRFPSVPRSIFTLRDQESREVEAARRAQHIQDDEYVTLI